MLVQATAALKNLFQDPKEVRGLALCDEDVGVLAKGLQWFIERMVDLQKSCYQGMLDNNELVM